MTSPRILLIGRDGQVGWELRRTLQPLGEVIALSRQELDLAAPNSIRSTVHALKPQWIVNAAAYTAVDKAESEPAVAMAINGYAPGVLAEEARRIGAALIHYSTDYVFDGARSTPYTEEDAPNPLSVYGRSKLAGEEVIRAAGVPHLVLRTSWVYAARGRNFLLTILRLAGERNELRIVNDQIGAPTWSRHIAQATAQIMAHCLSSSSIESVTGLYNLTAAGAASWFDFAEEILKQRGGLVPKLIRIPTSEYPTAAKRPLNSRLSCVKVKNTFGVVMPDWKTDLRLCLQELSSVTPESATLSSGSQ